MNEVMYVDLFFSDGAMDDLFDKIDSIEGEPLISFSLDQDFIIDGVPRTGELICFHMNVTMERKGGVNILVAGRIKDIAYAVHRKDMRYQGTGLRLLVGELYVCENGNPFEEKLPPEE